MLNKAVCFLNSNFRRVLNVVCFLLGNSPASEFYMPTFRTLCLFHLHKWVGMKRKKNLLYTQVPPKKMYTHFNIWYLCIVFEAELNYHYNMSYVVFSTNVATRMTVRSCDVWRMIVKEGGRSTVDVWETKVHFKVVYKVRKCRWSSTSVETWVSNTTSNTLDIYTALWQVWYTW